LLTKGLVCLIATLSRMHKIILISFHFVEVCIRLLHGPWFSFAWWSRPGNKRAWSPNYRTQSDVLGSRLRRHCCFAAEHIQVLHGPCFYLICKAHQANCTYRLINYDIHLAIIRRLRLAALRADY
jgi:hypothetical protein